MNNNPIQSSMSPQKWLYALITIHVFFWTLVPTLIRHTLPMDAVEGYVWGQHLQLGYDRNPWLNAWLTRVAVEFGGSSGWLVYLFSQISVAICFFALWKLGKKFLPPVYVLIAIFLLEAVQYYTIATIDFNDNVLEIGLWALIYLFFYSATKEQKILDWILVGIFAGLATMAKYYAVMLFLPMFLFLLMTKESRISFKKPGLYFGILIGILICLPHFIWVIKNNPEPIKYALMRVSAPLNEPHTSPLYFFGMQLAAFIAPLLLFLLLVVAGKPSSQSICKRQYLTSFENKFLIVIGFGPLFFTVIIAAIAKMSLHTLWGTPLLSLWGLALVAWTQPVITKQKFYRFTISIFIVFFLILAGYTYSILYVEKKSSANYPGKQISQYVSNVWHKYYSTNPSYIMGDRYTAGNIAIFMPNNPRVYFLDTTLEQNINSADLREKGTILVWREDKQDDIKSKGLKILPKLKAIEIKEFSWIRNKENEAPIKIGIALIPKK